MSLRRYEVGEWLDSPLSRRSLDLGGLTAERLAVQEICERVRREGDAAITELSLRFDGWGGEPIRIPPAEVEAAPGRLPPSDRAALEFAAGRIRAFHQTQVAESVTGLPGLKLLVKPVRRAGIYVPGGRAAYPSTVLMGAIPARVAGVEEVALVTPPLPDGSVPLPILAAAAIAGVDEVYRAGGAQAIAALAHGTLSIPRVDVIAGPGNIYVTLAKREMFGLVGIDSIAGPTEILIVADRTAPAAFVAADLASQLEHDPLAWALLVTDSPELATAVESEFAALLERLDRSAIIGAAHCAVVLVDGIEQALQVSNRFAPEHLELIVEDAERWVPRVENAGAVFVGPYAAVSLGDYVVGTNHTLPTAGSARFASPLGVHTFQKRTSVASLNRGDLGALQEACRAMARMEGLTAHAHAVEVRLDG